jgi:hypothetical protein
VILRTTPTPRVPPRGAPAITADASYGAATVTNVNVWVPTVVDVNCYNHAPRLFRLPGSSRIYLFWQQGARNEDAGGTHIVGVYSDDSGATWSAQFTVQTAFNATDLVGNTPSQTCVMLEFVTIGSRSFIIGEIEAMTWAAAVQLTRVSMGMMAIEVTGGVFSAPQWIIGSGATGPGGPTLSSWTGDTLSDLLTAMSSPGYAGGGINNGFPKIAEGSPDFLIECGVYKYADGYIRIGRGYDPIGAVSLSSFVYVQWSPDGVVYSTEQVTTIPNAPALIAFIKMVNAKLCFAWNVDADRNKLVLAVGTTGLRFPNSYTVRSGTGTTPTFPGQYKGGGPQYPNIIERDDGKLLIAYSIWKEKIAVSIVTVP